MRPLLPVWAALVFACTSASTKPKTAGDSDAAPAVTAAAGIAAGSHSSTAPAAPSATSVASALQPPIEQPGTARCAWAKPKGEAAKMRAEIRALLDEDRTPMQAGVAPATDEEKKQFAERQRIDDALEGTIGCEVSRVRGAMPPSYFTFAIEYRLPEVARCLHQPGRARREKLVVRLAFDERGEAKPAQLEPSKLEQAMAACVEGVFTLVHPADHQGDPNTMQPLTDEAQANASAVVQLELDMPSVR